MKFIELTVAQEDGSPPAAMMFNVANIAAFLPNPGDINAGGRFISINDSTFTKVEESYSQIKEKLNEI